MRNTNHNRIQGSPLKATGEDGLPIPPYSSLYNIGGRGSKNLMEFVRVLAEELKEAGVLGEEFNIEQHIVMLPMQPGDVPITYADSSGLEEDYGLCQG